MRALLILLILAGTAYADVTTYTVEGKGADRTKALDDAFQVATRKALDTLVTAPAQKQAQETLDTEVLARARLWVASFKVQAERDGTPYEADVDVRIDVDKLRDKLVDLGVTLRDAVVVDDGEPAEAAREAVLLLRLDTVEGAYFTFGEAADDGVLGVGDAEVSLARRGLALVAAPGGSSPKAKGAPIADDAARELASDAGAEVALVAWMDVAAPGRVRGAAGVATLAHAEVRAIDAATGRVLGTGRAARGATGDAAAVVSATAVRAALLEAIAVAIPRREPTSSSAVLPLPAAGKGQVLARLRGATGVEVQTIRTYLLATQGVKQVSLRRIAADEIVLGVKGLKADRVAALIRSGNDRADVRVTDGAVEVEIIAPTAQPEPEQPTVRLPW